MFNETYRRGFAMIRFATVVLCGLLAAPFARAETVVVFAAASLKTALDPIAAAWEQETGQDVVIAYDGSAKLARQIIAGAPADVFLSAATEWMDAVDAAGLVAPGTRRDLLGNRLVLVAHGAAPAVQIGPDLDLAGMLGTGRLAMGMVDSVPAGQYGKAALENLGLWDDVQERLAQSENVRAALALVSRGEVPLGIVYASDAIAADAAGDAVSVVGTFPADSHPPIIYPVAALAAGKPAAVTFLKALSSDAATATFEAQGFQVLK
jgi:molybdate transport system substrate-binding protein